MPFLMPRVPRTHQVRLRVLSLGPILLQPPMLDRFLSGLNLLVYPQLAIVRALPVRLRFLQFFPILSLLHSRLQLLPGLVLLQLVPGKTDSGHQGLLPVLHGNYMRTLPHPLLLLLPPLRRLFLQEVHQRHLPLPCLSADCHPKRHCPNRAVPPNLPEWNISACLGQRVCCLHAGLCCVYVLQPVHAMLLQLQPDQRVLFDYLSRQHLPDLYWIVQQLFGLLSRMHCRQRLFCLRQQQLPLLQSIQPDLILRHCLSQSLLRRPLRLLS